MEPEEVIRKEIRMGFQVRQPELRVSKSITVNLYKITPILTGATRARTKRLVEEGTSR